MVQDQMTQAFHAALSGGTLDDLGGIGADGRRTAGGVLKAMLAAKNSGCECEPCRLLRPELDKVMAVAIQSLSEVLTAPDQAAPTPPPAATPQVIESAPGSDNPA